MGSSRRGRQPRSPHHPPWGAEGSEAGSGAAAEAAVSAARPGPRVFALLAGFRHPIVAILLAIAFFTAISGKPVDGVLMLIAAVSLAWDAGRRAGDDGGGAVTDEGPPATGAAAATATAPGVAAPGAAAPGIAAPGEPVPGEPMPGVAAPCVSYPGEPAPGVTAPGEPAPGVTAPGGAGPGVADSGAAGPAGGARGLAGARRRVWRWRKVLLAAALLAGGAAYAGVVGSFIRYSWPATAAIIGLGTVVVMIGWRGPVRRRQVPGRLPIAGTAVWGLLFVAGCLWELAALLKQPTLTTTSYAHPTVSTLTDPVLANAGGRSAMLAAWLAVGWYLVRR